MKKTILFLFNYLATLFLLSCAFHIIEIRYTPHHKTNDPELAIYVNEWLDLAKKEHISFKRTVTVGFKRINEDYTIGACYYGHNFREIDVDSSAWKRMTNITRTALVWHELSHCYCGRDHDFAKGKVYPPPRTKEIENKSEGYYWDGCPLTLMHPVVVSDICFIMHYDDYVHEQFDRCEPY